MTSTWEHDIDQAIANIERHSIEPVEACASERLQRFQAEREIELPAAYARFLAAVGGNCGDFLMGSDLAFPVLPGIGESAARLLQRCGGPDLPGDAFVFCMHQGYQFLFLQMSGAPDPPVSSFTEGQATFEVVAPSFSSWLTDAVGTEYPETRAPDDGLV